MKLIDKKLALIVAVLAMPMAAIGQDNESTKVASVDEPIDNVVVTGEKSTSELRRDMWKYEDEFYSLYNSLNDDSEFDVRCTMEAPIGSRIRVQVCRPVFVTNAMKNGEVINVTNMQANPIIANDMAEYREKVNTLIAANPDLQQAVTAFSNSRTKYMESEAGDK